MVDPAVSSCIFVGVEREENFNSFVFFFHALGGSLHQGLVLVGLPPIPVSLSSSLSLSLSLSLFLSVSLSLSLSLSLSPPHVRQVMSSVKNWILFVFFLSQWQATTLHRQKRRKRTATENDSDNEFDEIETLCEEVVELYNTEKKAEEVRRAETGQTSLLSESETEAKRAQRAGTDKMSSSDQSEPGNESDYKVLLTSLAEALYLHRQRAARHGRVDRLKKLVAIDFIAEGNTGEYYLD